ncbi:MAG: HlyD family secretion protein [bacterium]
MSNRARLLISLAGLVIAAALLLFWQRSEEPATETAAGTTTADTTAAAPASDRPEAAFAEGRLAPQRQATLAFESGGQVAAILVQEGATVSNGAPLLRLDSADQEIALQQAQAAVAQAQANVEAAEASLDTARQGLAAAQLGVDMAQAQLDLVQEEPSAEQVALAESAVQAASAGVSQAAGQREVTLETNSADIASAEARLAAAEANLFAARIANQPIVQDPDAAEDEREQAAYRLNAATSAVEAIQAELEQLRAGATEAEARAASSAVSEAAYQRDAAQAQLDLLQVGARPEEVAVAEAGVRQAQQSVTEAEANVLLAESALQQAQAELQTAQADEAAAEDALQRRTLRASLDGTVANLHVKEGEVVSAGRPAVTLGDWSRWTVKTTDLSELDVSQFEPGLSVDVTVDAFPDRLLGGEVLDIARTAQTSAAGAAAADLSQSAQSFTAEVSGGSTSGDDVTYEVTVLLEDLGDLPLRWGMTAFVTLPSGSNQ